MSRYGRDGDCRVHLRRDNFNVAWGFRLQGGRDVGTSLNVQRVFSGSPADGQLQRGDVILTVDDHDVTNFNLNQVQDLIKSSGVALSVVVRRSRDLVNDTSPVKQTESFQQQQQQQQPSFAGSNQRMLGPQTYTPKVPTATSFSNQYYDGNVHSGERSSDNQQQQPNRFDNHQNINSVSSANYYAAGPATAAAATQRSAPVPQTMIRQTAAAPVHQATVRQTPVHHQTPTAPNQPPFNNSANYTNQDFSKSSQRAMEPKFMQGEQYDADERGSFNTSPRMMRPAAAAAAQPVKQQSNNSQWSNQQNSAREKQWHGSPLDSKHEFLDEHPQLSSNEQAVHQAMNQQQQQQWQQQEEEEEHSKSVVEIKQMFNKPCAPSPARGQQNVGSSSKSISARNTPPYQQKSSYNPLAFVGVTGKPKSPTRSPGSIQRGPPPEPKFSTTPSSYNAEADPLMDFYLHGFDAKHGAPPLTTMKFNGVSNTQSAPKAGGFGGKILPPRSLPAAKKSTPSKKQEFNPAQSAVFRMLQEEEEKGKFEEETNQTTQPVPKLIQNQPRKAVENTSSNSRLQQLLERDQAQLAPFQESEPKSQYTSHQSLANQQQDSGYRGSSMPPRKPEASNKLSYDSSTLNYSSRINQHDAYQPSYQVNPQNSYSNTSHFYRESEGYGTTGYPISDF